MWVRCAAQPTLAALNPEPPEGDSEARRWGVALAQVCADALRAGTTTDEYLRVSGLTVASNGVTIDEEMREAAQLYTESVLATCGDAELHVEEFLEIPTVHANNKGRMDLWFAQPGIVHVYELKGGHRFVDEFENYQLINYAEAVLNVLGINGIADQNTRVVLHVIQPRAYHRRGVDREWSVMACDLRPYVNTLRLMADRAHLEDPPATVNEYCGDCRGRVFCEAATSAAYESAERAYSSVPLDISPTSTGAELRMLQRAKIMLDARVSGLEEQAKAQMRMGAHIPFYSLEQGYGRQAWTADAETLKALAAMMGLADAKLFKPAVPVTPKQAIKAGLPAEIVGAYSHTPPGEVKLVPADDKKARRIFGA
jgi:hypothetical protein